MPEFVLDNGGTASVVLGSRPRCSASRTVALQVHLQQVEGLRLPDAQEALTQCNPTHPISVSCVPAAIRQATVFTGQCSTLKAQVQVTVVVTANQSE